MIFLDFHYFLNRKNDFGNIRFQASDLSKILARKYCYLLFLAKAETNLKSLSISLFKLIIQDILSIHRHWQYQGISYLVLALK